MSFLGFGADGAQILRSRSTDCKWAHEDSNFGPHPYQGCALAN